MTFLKIVVLIMFSIQSAFGTSIERHFRREINTLRCLCTGNDIIFKEITDNELTCAARCKIDGNHDCVNFLYDKNDKSCTGCSKKNANQGIDAMKSVMCYTEYVDVISEPRDCLDVYQTDQTASDGVYSITTKMGSQIDVYCAMSFTDGGWTTILQRYNGQVAFDQGFDEYESGFGNKSGEHWLGLRYIHEMTVGTSSLLYIVSVGSAMHIIPETTVYEGWSGFSVDSGPTYALRIGSLVAWTYVSFDEIRGPLLNASNGLGFSTKEFDRDVNDIVWCSKLSGEGGWWYSNCTAINPTGIYMRKGLDAKYAMFNANFMGRLAVGNMTILFKRDD